MSLRVINSSGAGFHLPWGLCCVVALVVCNSCPNRAAADSLYAWGDNGAGQFGNGTTANSSVPIAIASLSSGVTAIGGTQSSSFAVKNGAAYAFGSNVWGNLGTGAVTPTSFTTPYAIPSLSSGVTAITGAYYASGAIRNGGIYGWGTNNYGAIGNGTENNSYAPVAASVMTSGVTAVAFGGNGTADHVLGIKSGAVYSWG